MSCQGSSRGKSVSLNLVKLERCWPLSIACLLLQVSSPNHLSVAFPALGDTKPHQARLLMQGFAYSYRVWITLIKRPYAPLRYFNIGLNIHQGEP